MKASLRQVFQDLVQSRLARSVAAGVGLIGAGVAAYKINQALSPEPERRQVTVSGQKVDLDVSVPLIRRLPSDPEKLEQKLRSAIAKAMPERWTHAQVAIPASVDLEKLPGAERTRLAIPLPGEALGTPTVRIGSLHAHTQGPVHLVHEDAHEASELAHAAEAVRAALLRLKETKPFVQEKEQAMKSAQLRAAHDMIQRQKTARENKKSEPKKEKEPSALRRVGAVAAGLGATVGAHGVGGTAVPMGLLHADPNLLGRGQQSLSPEKLKALQTETEAIRRAAGQTGEVAFRDVPAALGSHYHPGTKRVVVGTRGVSEKAIRGIALHEAGHGAIYKRLGRAAVPTAVATRMAFQLSPLAGLVAGGMSDKETAARNAALTTAALAAPTLADEAGATAWALHKAYKKKLPIHLRSLAAAQATYPAIALAGMGAAALGSKIYHKVRGGGEDEPKKTEKKANSLRSAYDMIRRCSQ